MTASTKVVSELVRTACYAPSVHNTQPWAWRIVDADTVELLADRRRQLSHIDPHGRELVISCGAALHHFLVAAPAFYRRPELTVLTGDDDVLARVTLTSAPMTDTAVELLAALEYRATDRTGFTSWPVPRALLEKLEAAARTWGAHATALTDPADLHRAELLAGRARELQRADVGVRREQEDWVEHGYAAVDGVPSSRATPAATEGRAARAGRFGAPTGAEADPEVLAEHPDGLMVLFTGKDERQDWLHAGMALSAMWIEATRHNLSLIPETQPTEVPETRDALRQDLLDGMGWPQALVRVGFRSPVRSHAPRTPRRPLEDVLVT